MTTFLIFVIMLAIGGAFGVGILALVVAVVLTVVALARLVRLVRRVFYVALAWRAGEWNPVTEIRVRWSSRRLDSQLDWLMADTMLPHREP